MRASPQASAQPARRMRPNYRPGRAAAANKAPAAARLADKMYAGKARSQRERLKRPADIEQLRLRVASCLLARSAASARRTAHSRSAPMNTPDADRKRAAVDTMAQAAIPASAVDRRSNQAAADHRHNRASYWLPRARRPSAEIPRRKLRGRKSD